MNKFRFIEGNAGSMATDRYVIDVMLEFVTITC